LSLPGTGHSVENALGPDRLDLNMPAPQATLACVVLAHGDPTHLSRLVRALDPFPVFLHVDARTDDAVFTAMTDGLPDRARVLDRHRTGWARWENVVAEIEGYRAALAATDATHVALLTGTDYPLASSAEIVELLDRYRGVSFGIIDPLPHPEWGQNHGFSRLRYPHWAWRKHMIRVPVPRRFPDGVVLAGGSQLKVLARHHAEAVVRAYDSSPDLVRFWRRSWVADETFVPSVLSTPRFVADWDDASLRTTLWMIGWDGTRRKSPPWLTDEWHEQVMSRRSWDDQPVDHVFARKFSTATSTPLLDRIDAARAADAAARTVRTAGSSR
jgi:hypothetical protein